MQLDFIKYIVFLFEILPFFLQLNFNILNDARISCVELLGHALIHKAPYTSLTAV